MSIFTKIFVILVMVLSVLLVGLVVSFVYNVDTYKQRWLEAQASAETFKSNAANARADLETLIQGATERAEEKEGEVARLQAQINEKDQDLQSMQAQVIRLENTNAGFQTELAKLSSASEQNSKIIAMLEDEVKMRRDETLKLTTRNLDLSEALNEATTEAETYEQQVRLLSEHIADLERQYEEVVQTAGSGRKSDDGSSYGPLADLTSGISPDRPIRGMVTGVDRIGDEVFVAINVGTNDGVREGMRFMIHRGEQYLGDAVVMQVSLNGSSGRVTLKAGAITPDAQVLASDGLP